MRATIRWMVAVVVLVCGRAMAAPASVEQWGVYEVELNGPAEGNPFVDVELWARFSCEGANVEVRGFYDGDGIYRVRFMPERQGVWRYKTRSNRPELSGRSGDFTCAAPTPGNRGPVRVHNRFHFAYADGTPYKPVGTTAYGWVHQPEALKAQTLVTLKASPFNKIRMCIFPTRYRPGRDAPILCPFVPAADNRFDLTRPDVRFFRQLERHLLQLQEIGVEADLILFHPYDDGQMGFDRMSPASDELYLRYCAARLSAYRNVWWSLANEFDLMKEKTDADWDRFFKIIQAEDPSAHLRSVHFSQRVYNPGHPWVTHLSAQNGQAVADFGRAVLYRQACGKPVVYDEVCYEGNLSQRWGQLSGEEMVLRFWHGTIAGTYVGHGEALTKPNEPTWLSSGGVLRGDSPQRIAFLKKVLDEAPAEGIEPIDEFYSTRIGGRIGWHYLVYFGADRPTEWNFQLPRGGLEDGMKFDVEVLDTWNMTITRIEQTFTIVRRSPYIFGTNPEQTIPLPGRPYLALRIRRSLPQ